MRRRRSANRRELTSTGPESDRTYDPEPLDLRDDDRWRPPTTAEGALWGVDPLEMGGTARSGSRDAGFAWSGTHAGDDLDRPKSRAASTAGPLIADDSLAMYLREISQSPLLSAEDEISLARQVEAGVAAAATLAAGVEEDDERRRYDDAVERGRAARERLIESNLRLVVSIARKYAQFGLPLLDLIQEGNIGLQRGVDKYDWRRGFRFSTYAYWWIRQAISRGLGEYGRAIRLPVHANEQLSRYFKAEQALQFERGRSPTRDEVAKALGTEVDKLRSLVQVAEAPISLETPLDESDGAAVGDLIADMARPPDDEIDDELLAQSVDRALREHLSPREVTVLRLRFGLGDVHERTLDEIGRELGVSRERVRQLESAAIRKLQAVNRFRTEFRDYVG